MSGDQLAAYNSASWFDMAIVPAALNLVWVSRLHSVISAGRALPMSRHVPRLVCPQSPYSPARQLVCRVSTAGGAADFTSCVLASKLFSPLSCACHPSTWSAGGGLLPHHLCAGQQAHPGSRIPKHVSPHDTRSSCTIALPFLHFRFVKPPLVASARTGLHDVPGCLPRLPPSTCLWGLIMGSYPCAKTHCLCQFRFTAMVERPSARKSALAKLVLSAPKPVQPAVYLG